MKRLRVSLFMRKPRTGENYSIERLFDAVSAALPEDRYEVRRLVCPFESTGVVRRLLCVFWAALNQGDINHVTGDVNFLNLLLHSSRTVLTIHDSASMRRLTGLQRWLYRWIWLRLPISRAACVTVVSESTLHETLEYAGGDAHKFRVIPNCITGGLAASPGSFNSRQPRILQVGTKENKNLARVIEALTGIPCMLVVVGSLSAQQKQLLKDGDMTYENHPSLDAAAMSLQYQLADVVVFVSTYEGFGLPILEAQAVGRAVVTSARAPMDRVAGAGAALVNPDDVAEIRDAIRKVVEDAPYRNSLIEAGFENVKRYSPVAVAAEYAAVYEALFVQAQRA
ncbi:MAG: glycosyltransferase family 4 protein [Nitrosomonadales bacterium]|nr:glycosyltransferase family 4 protein [Nitrosomonadales bacterium]